MPLFTPVSPSTPQSFVDWIGAGLANLRSTVHGLEDDQVRSRPVPSSELTLEWLLLHVSGCALEWSWRAEAGRAGLETDSLPFTEQMRIGEGYMTLPVGAGVTGLLAEYDERVTRVVDVVRRVGATEGSLAVEVPLPDVPWFRPGIGPVDARWCLWHLYTEIQRHSGHADILREAIDGRTMYELVSSDQGEDLGYIQDWFAAHPEVPAPTP